MAEFLLANRYFDPKNLSEPFENKVVDWAGFEPAIFRLRIERSYHAEPPAQ